MGNVRSQEVRMLACERHGRGEPLVLVHGLVHRRQAWYPVLDELTAHREVILVDLPGHGQSPPFELAGRTAAQALRDEFFGFLAAQGLDRAHLAGNSLGGLLALEAGARGLARSVTALSPAGFWRSTSAFNYRRQVFLQAGALSDRLGGRGESLARSRAGRQLMYGLTCAHPARVTADQAVGDLRGFRRARPALGLMLDAATPFAGHLPLDVPVTIAWAARDLVLPVWHAQIAREVLPQAEHVVLRGLGHVPMTDDPKAVAEILLRGSAPVAAVTSLPERPRGTSGRRAASA
jgi:pimeloyl-ACP methyl ester carboxylesterase